MAHDLLWLIPKPAVLTAAQFERRHRKTIVSGSLTAVQSFDKGRYETTRVKLAGQAFTAGIVPLALSAFSCPDGCDIRVWALEFGHLGPESKKKLAEWVRALPPATEEATRPQMAEGPKGEVSLVCDLTL